ncbi:MAG: fumarate hydratase [Methanobrevibacter sp.]|jgi:fumarate hydratase subunit alpha|nr:fumarate hydratase [Candidatus Methanovirga basalitermitum]
MDLADKVEKTLIRAGTRYSKDRAKALKNAYLNETSESAKWALNLMIKNMEIAEKDKVPLCDDTGIPHVLIEVGNDVKNIPNRLFEDIKEGISLGLKNLPGRPMAVKGNDIERIEQSKGLCPNSENLKPASFLIDTYNGDKIKVHILLLGGGSEIRAKTRKVFHKRDYNNIFNLAFNHLKDNLKLLGCTPAIPSIGIGRTHFEATSLMLKGMAYGSLDKQSDLEKNFSERLNQLQIGAMGLGGNATVLGSFINIGEQRASGVRILAIRPSCFVEPRTAFFEF